MRLSTSSPGRDVGSDVGGEQEAMAIVFIRAPVLTSVLESARIGLFVVNLGPEILGEFRYA